jgi:ribosome-associated protein
VPVKKKSDIPTEKITKEKKSKKPVEKTAPAAVPVIPAEKESIDTDILELNCIADAMLDKKAQRVISLDLKKIGTAISDYFIVCSADSTPNVLAIADNVEEMMYKICNRKVVRAQGKENAFWIILDYTNIVVHIFKTEYRQFYRLEDLWADAGKKTYQE